MPSLTAETLIKKNVLEATTFGKRVAEEEEQQLKYYFIETKQWKNIISGEIDILYGSKGSGKSAIYSLLLNRAKELLAHNIILIPAENPHGFPIFQELATDPPTREDEFRRLWKIYFLTLIANYFRSSKLKNKKARSIISVLEEAGLITKDESLLGTLSSALRYVRNIKVESVEAAGLKLDPLTGNPKGIAIGKITFGEPTPAQVSRGFISADTLLKTADEILSETGKSLWLIIDRLDVAFAHSDELEGNALRALFGVYRDFTKLKSVSLKIFLRSDIWRRITDKRVPEASHITRYDTLTWDTNSLMELIVSRLLHNQAIKDYYKLDEVSSETVLRSSHQRKTFFYRIFPPQVPGKKVTETFDWILESTRDALGMTSPRELIHLLNEARDIQLQRFDEMGQELSDERLFSFESIKQALPIVSKARYELTLCAENPQIRELLQWLEGRKATQTLETLSEAWGLEIDEVNEAADKLMEAGVFERKGTRNKPVFYIAPIYRDALKVRKKALKIGKYISHIPETILHRIGDAGARAFAVTEIAKEGGEGAFETICVAFDDDSAEVRNAAARALFNLGKKLGGDNYAGLLTQAIREGTPPRRRSIGEAINSSGIAAELLTLLTSQRREQVYEAFSWLFLMAKAGEVEPLIQAVERYPDNEVRLAVIKLLSLAGQKEILPAFRRLAVRGSLPTEVRSAVMQAIYQISSQQEIGAEPPQHKEE